METEKYEGQNIECKMMTRSQKCEECREALRLEVVEAAVPRTPEAKAHLAGCSECRQYAEQLRATVRAVAWMATRPVSPRPGLRARWTAAVEAAPPAGLLDSLSPALDAVRCWWRRNLRPACVLAPVWMVILLLKVTAPDIPVPPQQIPWHSPVSAFRQLRAEQQLLANQNKGGGRPESLPLKAHPSQPRTESTPAAGGTLEVTFHALRFTRHSTRILA